MSCVMVGKYLNNERCYWFLSGTWSRSSERSGIWVSVVSEGSLLISMTWVDIQDEPRKTKSVGTLVV